MDPLTHPVVENKNHIIRYACDEKYLLIPPLTK